MNARAFPLIVAATSAALTLASQGSAQIITTTDSFGSGGNTFTIDFVSIGNVGNAADTRAGSGSFGRGAVPYEYRIGTYEISQNNIDHATASGLANVTAGRWAGNQPAANISWYEAAAFVNWMNTSTGKQAAYNLTFSGGSWSMTLWSSADAWTLGGTNLYRHKNAYYFLPSENEWYKAAYYNPAGTNYFLYPTGSDAVPAAVAGGTSAGTMVYEAASPIPVAVTNAGGLSPLGTMAQGGNVSEWMETAFSGTNDGSGGLSRTVRGGWWSANQFGVSAAFRNHPSASEESQIDGLRVASVPEPSTYALLLLSGAASLWALKRRKS
jgi:hypothetical protein